MALHQRAFPGSIAAGLSPRPPLPRQHEASRLAQRKRPPPHARTHVAAGAIRLGRRVARVRYRRRRHGVRVASAISVPMGSNPYDKCDLMPWHLQPGWSPAFVPKYCQAEKSTLPPPNPSAAQRWTARMAGHGTARHRDDTRGARPGAADAAAEIINATVSGGCRRLTRPPRRMHSQTLRSGGAGGFSNFRRDDRVNGRTVAGHLARTDSQSIGKLPGRFGAATAAGRGPVPTLYFSLGAVARRGHRAHHLHF
ncbi:hypothetical protein ON010_g2346 [Phytophthora cinnamomi]|nr:hypothetical protein ON010_g2346 [Phytophthora cinnamomi]